MTGEGDMPPMPHVTFLTVPMRPCFTRATACRKRCPHSVRCMVPTWKTRPVSLTTFSINFPSSMVSVSGFSQ